MATTWIISPDMFDLGELNEIGAVSGDFFAASDTHTVDAPSFGGRSGDNAFRLGGLHSYESRFVLKNGAQNEVIVHCAFNSPELPASNNRIRIRFASSANATLGYFMIDAAGFAHVLDSGLTILSSTTVPVLDAAEWTLFEMRVLMNGASSEFELRNEAGDVLIDASGITLSSTAVGQIGLVSGAGNNQGHVYYISDLWVKDTTGSRNNGFGARRIYTRKLTGDHQDNEWAFQARRKVDDGILQIPAPSGNKGLSVADAAGLEAGSSDFTIEGRFRWEALPAAGTTRHLVSKWRENNNTRSWRLRSYEASGETRLAFEISTDGTGGTVVAVHDVIFEPVLNHWYDIAVSRDSGVSYLLIDGVRTGPAVADANTYYDGSAPFVVGAAGASFSNTESFEGWIDEVRFTVGAARYNSEYTPSDTKFPRDSSDPLWAQTQFLAGFDALTIADESQYARSITTFGASSGVAAQVPNDGDFGYQSIDKLKRDDTFIEAAFLPASATLEFVSNPSNAETVTIGTLTSAATGVLTLTGNAANGETVTLGSKTYTFQTVLTDVDGNVLIGASASDSLDNLIAAITLGSGSGTLYAASTTLHPTVTAAAGVGDTMDVTANAPGATGNSIATTETMSNGSFGGATLSGGSADVVYTFVNTLSSSYDVLIGADADESMINLRSAINQESGEGTIYGAGTIAHPDAEALDIAGVQIRIQARVPGTAGDDVTLASDVTDVSVSSATLEGGVDIPGPSEFNFEPVPSGVTAISAVALATRRSLVGSGTAEVQFGIRDAADNLILGTEHVPPANPAWNVDMMDSGAGASSWSAAALIGARTYNNRTS